MTQATRDALLQDLDHRRRRSSDLFANEQADVLGHDNVTHVGKPLAVPQFAKNLDENISGANRAQQGQVSITSENDEMQMAASVVANEFVGHDGKGGTPRPFKRESVGSEKAKPVPRR